jgi:DNA-directed RNA polymerase subunit M/transcription elongation factor TFIIS
MITVLSMNDTREKVFDKLFETIQNPDLTRDLEKAIIDYTAKHVKEKFKQSSLVWSDKTIRRVYLRKYRSVLSNIKSIKTLIEKGYDVNTLMDMMYYEVDPERWESTLNALKKREIGSLVAYADDVHDGLLTCYQCKSKKTRYTTMQTRSGDEPTTIYARCLNCGLMWTE